MGIECWWLGCEYARDATLLPAVYRDNRIVIRSDALTRMLWEKWELWRSRPHLPPDRQAAVAHYGDVTGRLTFALQEGMVRVMASPLYAAYQEWRTRCDPAPLLAALERTSDHLQALLQTIDDAFRRDPDGFPDWLTQFRDKELATLRGPQG